MSRFTISILLVFGLLQLNYTQNKIQQIKPEKILYKSIDSIDLFLHVYRPKSFDKSIGVIESLLRMKRDGCAPF